MDARASPLSCDAAAAFVPNPAMAAAITIASAVPCLKLFQVFTVFRSIGLRHSGFPATFVARWDGYHANPILSCFRRSRKLQTESLITSLRPVQRPPEPPLQHLLFRVELMGL